MSFEMNNYREQFAYIFTMRLDSGFHIGLFHWWVQCYATYQARTLNAHVIENPPQLQ